MRANKKATETQFEYLIVKDGAVIGIEKGFYKAVFAAAADEQSPELGAHIAGQYDRAENVFTARNGMRMLFNVKKG